MIETVSTSKKKKSISKGRRRNYGNLNFSVNKQVGDKNGRILILDVNIDELRYVLVNIYNANTEVEQVQVLSELNELMKNINFSKENCIVLAGDLNVFLILS